MKILISDYKDSMMPDHEYETSILKAGFPDAEIEVYEYTDEKRDEFIEKMRDVTVLLTAFIKIDKTVMEQAPNLLLISINATGYDNVDLYEATRHSIGVCPVGEYCTIDVAEHAIALMMALNKNLKKYTYDIEQHYNWKYDTPEPPKRIGEQTLGIFGFGKIGRQVARFAQGLGMKVIAHDPYVSAEVADKLGVSLVEKQEIFEQADVITNHMSLGESNTKYFTANEFQQMKKAPIFLNLGRGLSIDEKDLVDALDRGMIRGAGLDVLEGENILLEGHPLVGRDDVIVTPHAAFYSEQSFLNMQRISCENIVNFIHGKKEKVFRLVNEI